MKRAVLTIHRPNDRWERQIDARGCLFTSGADFSLANKSKTCHCLYRREGKKTCSPLAPLLCSFLRRKFFNFILGLKPLNIWWLTFAQEISPRSDGCHSLRDRRLMGEMIKSQKGNMIVAKLRINRADIYIFTFKRRDQSGKGMCAIGWPDRAGGQS